MRLSARPSAEYAVAAAVECPIPGDVYNQYDLQWAVSSRYSWTHINKNNNRGSWFSFFDFSYACVIRKTQNLCSLMEWDYLSSGADKIVFVDLYIQITYTTCLTRKVGTSYYVIHNEICLCGIYWRERGDRMVWRKVNDSGIGLIPCVDLCWVWRHRCYRLGLWYSVSLYTYAYTYYTYIHNVKYT